MSLEYGLSKRAGKKRERKKMFGCGFLLLLFVWCCCCLGDVAGSSADASGHEAVLSGSHVLSVLHGPVACHVDTAQIQVVVEHSGVLPLSLALLSEQQLLQVQIEIFYFLFFFLFFCFV